MGRIITGRTPDEIETAIGNCGNGGISYKDIAGDIRDNYEKWISGTNNNGTMHKYSFRIDNEAYPPSVIFIRADLQENDGKKPKFVGKLIQNSIVYPDRICPGKPTYIDKNRKD